MSSPFVRFTVADTGGRPIVFNVHHVAVYAPWHNGPGTFIGIGSDEYHVAESFEDVDLTICAAMEAAHA